jgi:hypothetical protein
MQDLTLWQWFILALTVYFIFQRFLSILRSVLGRIFGYKCPNCEQRAFQKTGIERKIEIEYQLFVD